MHFSIRLWTILALNALVVAVSVALGWIAQDVAGRVVEERLATDMVARVSAFMTGRTFPLTDTTLNYLKQLLKSDWVVLDHADNRVTGSSLSGRQAEQFMAQVSRVGRAGTIRIDGQECRIDSCDLPNDEGISTADRISSGTRRLYVLIPQSEFQAARVEASRRVVSLILPATAVSTLLAVLLAFVTTRPIHRLTSEIGRLARREVGEVSVASPTSPNITKPIDAARRHALLSRGPRETRQLAASFYELLDRLEAARLRLAQNDRLATLGKVCLSVAHELRNPLSGIKMNMRVLKDRVAPADDAGVDAIMREIDRMGLYLDELMSLAPGSNAAATTPNPVAAKLSTLADSVLTILAGRCRHAGVEIRREYPEDEPLVPAEPNQLRQAMMNFVVNAIEAMPTGGTLTVGVRARPDSVGFFVSDTGSGVRHDGTHIFEAFSSHKPNGVGLGLYLARQVVVRHGGRIGYENLPVGVSFWFELPRASDAASPASLKLEATS